MSSVRPWRYLADDGVGAARGLAADEALMLHYGHSETTATAAILRLYTYRPYCALVGRYQNLEDEVDLDFCNAHDIQVGRRPTGGGAILMGPGQLGVAVATRAGAEETPRETLRRFAGGVIAGLEALGIAAAFRAKNDLEVAGRKIAGLGLYLDPRGALLFHASVLVDLDVELMLRVLRIPGAKVSDPATVERVGIERIRSRITTVAGELDRPALTAADLRETFGAGFAAACGVELRRDRLDAAEKRRRDELEQGRYGNTHWNHQRSPRRDARGNAVLKTPEGLLRIYVGLHGKVIKSALVAGDFNLLPPGIARLESALRWCRAEPGRIGEVTAASLSPDELGVPATAVSTAVWQAAERALELQERGRPERIEGSCYFPEPPQHREERRERR